GRMVAWRARLGGRSPRPRREVVDRRDRAIQTRTGNTDEENAAVVKSRRRVKLRSVDKVSGRSPRALHGIVDLRGREEGQVAHLARATGHEHPPVGDRKSVV